MSTTIKDLTINFKNLIKGYEDGTYGTTLKGLNTFKRGILSTTNTIFPSVSISPIREVLEGIRSGGYYYTGREILVEVICKHSNARSGIQYAQDFAKDIRDIFYDTNYPDNWKIPDGAGDDTISSFTINEQRSGEAPWVRGNVQFVSMVFNFRSNETTPTRTVVNTITQSAYGTVGEKIKDLLKAGVTAKFYYAHSVPPVKGQGVNITIMETPGMIMDQREAGRDSETWRFDISVWSRLSPYDGALDLNLETVESVKDILQTNPQLDGLVFNSAIESIDFGVNKKINMYGATFSFVAHGYKNLADNI